MYESSDIVMTHCMVYTKIYKHTPSDFVFLRKEDHRSFIDMIMEIYHTSKLPAPFIYVHCRINFYDSLHIRNIPPLLTDAAFDLNLCWVLFIFLNQPPD